MDKKPTYKEKKNSVRRKKINPVEIEGLIKRSQEPYEVSYDKALPLIIVEEFEFLFAMYILPCIKKIELMKLHNEKDVIRDIESVKEDNIKR